MAQVDSSNGVGDYLSRAGQRIPVVKLPDRFTVRLKRGVGLEKIEHDYAANHSGELRRQNLEEFAVEAAERDAVMDRVRSDNGVDFASHVYAPADEPEARLYPDGEITVQFAPGVTDEEIEGIVTEHGLTLLKNLLGIERAFVFQVGPQATENPLKIANRLALNEKVLLSEPNVAIASRSFYVPTDTLFPEQWHLFNNGGLMLSTSSHIDVVRAWDITRGERSVVVAVADDSCDLNHVDFQGLGKIVAPRDFGGQDFEPLPELVDDNHGTACCGVAVAAENGVGVVGVAPECALMPIRTSGFIDDTSIEDLCDWVIDHGASVLSCSWGVAARSFSLSLRMRSALHRAATIGRGGLGCVVVFASGNDNRPVNGIVDEVGWPGDQPSGPTQWHAGFAAHEDVIAVAASSSLATKSVYSNWGPEISVCAPSNNRPPRTFPSVTTPVNGLGILTTDRVGPSGYSTTDYTRSFGGTSSACPTVAGAAALVLSAHPGLTAVEVKDILQVSADKIVDGGTDPQLGNQFGDYDANGHSRWFGFGRINAFAAVLEARRRMEGTTGALIRLASAPAADIPDNLPIGVRDSINVAEEATLASLEVSVDISHTFVGDLRLTLTTPTGTSVVLHDRVGGSGDDLQSTFDIESTPGLLTLVGEPIAGDWQLWIQDLAAIDTGTLNRWELGFGIHAPAIEEIEDAPGIRLSGMAEGEIERVLSVTRDQRIDDMEVSLDITQTPSSALTVALVSPTGDSIVLHDGKLGVEGNLVRSFRLVDTPALQSFRDLPMRGDWRLRVAEHSASGNSKINRWALTFRTARV